MKIILFAVGGLVAFLVLVVVAMLLLGEVSAKSRLETAASEALGMEVIVGDRLGIHFFPGLHVILEDVHIRSRGGRLPLRRRPASRSSSFLSSIRKSGSKRLA